MAKRILKVVGIIVLIIVILFVALIAFLSATEYKPDYITQAEMSETSGNVEVDASKSID